VENNRLREELSRIQELHNVTQQLSQKEVEATRNIESKIRERQRLDEQHELERQERERLLAIARETKKHYKSPTPSGPPSPGRNLEDVHVVSDSLESLLQLTGDPDPTIAPNKAEIPTFDRAMKPQPRNVERTSQRVRDFSPVIGQNVVSIAWVVVVDSLAT